MEQKAPAFDADGNGWWKVWIGNALFPHTFPSHADAAEFAAIQSDAGYTIYTDFD